MYAWKRKQDGKILDHLAHDTVEGLTEETEKRNAAAAKGQRIIALETVTAVRVSIDNDGLWIEQEEQPIPAIEFEIIITYRQAEQDGIVIGFDNPKPTEAQLMTAVGKYLGVESTKYRRDEGDYDLCKLSVCQLNCAGPDAAMPWLLATNGKYYF